MSEKKKYCAPAVGCVGLIILIGLAMFVLWLVFKPNSTTVDQVSGKMVEKNNFIDVDRLSNWTCTARAAGRRSGSWQRY